MVNAGIELGTLQKRRLFSTKKLGGGRGLFMIFVLLTLVHCCPERSISDLIFQCVIAFYE